MSDEKTLALKEAADLFGTFTPEAYEQATKEGNVGNREGNYKLKEGRTVLRILPPHKKSATSSAWVTRWVHYARLSEDGKPYFCVCPKRMTAKYCPVCAVQSSLSASDYQKDQELALRFEPQKENYSNIYVRHEPGNPNMYMERKVRRFSFGKNAFERFTDLRETRDFTHPMNGRNLIITRRGTKKENTKYTFDLADDPSPIADPATMRELAEAMEPLDTLLVVRAPELLLKGFQEWAASVGFDVDAHLRKPQPVTVRQIPKSVGDDDGMDLGLGEGEGDDIPF